MKTKILFIMQLPPPVHGASMINKTILDSKLINEKFEADYVNLTTAADVKNIGKLNLKKVFKAFSIYLRVIKKLFSTKYNLVYLTLSPQGLAFYKDALLSLFIKLLGFKLVFHLHGKGIREIVSGNKIKASIYKKTFKNVSVIHLSKLLYFDIENIIAREQVYFLANGIESGNKFSIEHKSPTNKILYLSNMQESKGSYLLLQAAQLLRDKGLDFHIDFVGKWHNDNKFKEKWLKFYKDNNLNECITYHGPRYNDEKHVFFKEARIFALPTNNDCFPISILEAMSYGASIVSTEEGAIPEIVHNNHNGFLFEKNNPIELALKLEKLLINDNLNSLMQKKAHKKYSELYTKGKFEQDFCSIIQSILTKV